MNLLQHTDKYWAVAASELDTATAVQLMHQ